ncbi:hypothetical protein HZS_7490 [Henneguya salminicola]|nr:hypothetical protein HZS_7490 [Henneguya salminicola]
MTTSYEFQDIILRQGDKKSLNLLTKGEKFSLILSTLGCINIPDYSLQQDVAKELLDVFIYYDT